jgi:uncharacterized protein YqjF (DUF2071 family)
MPVRIPDHPRRPYPLPRRPWAMFMRWHDLLFIHWRVDPALLRPHIPPSLELETFDGSAWLGVVPFWMSGIRARFTPPMPGLSRFPELNVRTYVTAEGKPGVWFFSLDAANKVAVRTARWSFHLNYLDARMRCGVDAASSEVRYTSTRTHKGQPPARFEATYAPTGPSFAASPGSLDHFLTERYCLYAAAPDGRTFRGEIAHCPWPLQPARLDLRANTMAQSLGVPLSLDVPADHVRFGKNLDVVAWLPERVSPAPA